MHAFDRLVATTAHDYQAAYARWAGLPVRVTNGDGITLVLVPPGTFRMGSPAQEKGRSKDEEAFTATITRPFYLGKHELTVGQFRRFVERTSHVTDGERNGGGNAHDEKAVWKHRPGTSWKKPGFAGPYKMRDDHPVVHVSHDDATAYCRWATIRGGSRLRYALPTAGLIGGGPRVEAATRDMIAELRAETTVAKLGT